MGGRVGFDLATRVPERFYSLALGGAHPFAVETRLPGAVEALRQGMEAYTAASERQNGPLPIEARALWLKDDAEALLAARLTEWPDLEAELGTIATPVFIFCGEQDGPYPRAKRAAELIPNSTFLSLPELNHSQAFQRSDLVLPHLRAFLQRAGEAAVPQT